MAHRGCAVLHGPQDLVSPNELFYQFSEDITESSEEGKVLLILGSVTDWDLEGLLRYMLARGGDAGPEESLWSTRMAEW